jgi:ribA/ribD-fused uncharacterized protein
MKIIDSFSGNFDFLSNFSRHSFRDETGTMWQTNEHYYQAWKTLDFADRGRIWSAVSAGKAKKLGSEVALRSDWIHAKFYVMENGLLLKFTQNKGIKELLLQTDGYLLIEGNYWHDNFWGDCKCPKCENKTGQNWLGTLLMDLRKEILNG